MPTDRCGSCRKFISATEGVRCSKCNYLHHKLCVALAPRGSVPSSWRCPECKKGDPRDNKDDTPVRGRPIQGVNQPTEESYASSSNSIVSPVAIQEEREKKREITNGDIMEEIRAVRRDFMDFRKEISELQAEVQTCYSRIGLLEARVISLEQCVSAQAAPSESVEVNSVIAQLRAELNEREQDQLASDVEIQNIPEESGENPTHLVKLVATKMGLNIEERDIVSAERVGGRNLNATAPGGATETRPRPLVVRMARRDLRDELLRSARARRTVDTSDFGLSAKPHRLFVNERLTKLNRQLFRMARDVGRQHGWQFIWTHRGRILARRKPGDSVLRLRTENDINTHIVSLPTV